MGLLVESEPLSERRFRDVFDDLGHRVELEAEVTRYEPPHRLEVHLLADAFSARSSHMLREADSGTLLTTVVETEYTKRLARLAGPLVTRRAQRQLEADHRALKSLFERR
jgi:beta-phosphoglucomutase-like phosphatase (HAD superfamily)